MNKILYVRNTSDEFNITTYNSQEIGLCKAFVRMGFDCDIILYSNKPNKEDLTIYTHNNFSLNVRYKRGKKLFGGAIYWSLLNHNINRDYKFIISTEYHHIMTLLLSLFFSKKLFVYHGPYQDSGKSFLHKLYDCLITPLLRLTLKRILCKSNLASEYLKSKGFNNVAVVGVGLDVERLNKTQEQDIYNEIVEIPPTIKKILFVGSLDERKNILFMPEVLKLLYMKMDFRFIVVGKGPLKDVLHSRMEELGIGNTLMYYPQVKQEEIQIFYKNADVLVLPSIYEIFGMVLLESSFFGTPAVSSETGGAGYLIENGINGFVIKDYSPEKWADVLFNLLTNQEIYNEISLESAKIIKEKADWDVIASKIYSLL